MVRPGRAMGKKQGQETRAKKGSSKLSRKASQKLAQDTKAGSIGRILLCSAQLECPGKLASCQGLGDTCWLSFPCQSSATLASSFLFYPLNSLAVSDSQRNKGGKNNLISPTAGSSNKNISKEEGKRISKGTRDVTQQQGTSLAHVLLGLICGCDPQTTHTLPNLMVLSLFGTSGIHTYFTSIIMNGVLYLGFLGSTLEDPNSFFFPPKEFSF